MAIEDGAASRFDVARASPVGAVRRSAESTLVVLQGEVDLYNAHAVREVLEEECRASPEEVVVDLRAVEFLDSTALHILVAARRHLREWRSLVLLAPTPEVRRALETSGVDRVLTIRG